MDARRTKTDDALSAPCLKRANRRGSQPDPRGVVAARAGYSRSVVIVTRRFSGASTR